MLKRCEVEGWGAFIGDDRMSLKALVNHTFKPTLLPVLRTELKSRDISREWLKWIKGLMGVSTKDVNAAFLRLALVVESSPFRVRHAQPEERAAIDTVLRYFCAVGSEQSAEGTGSRTLNPSTDGGQAPPKGTIRPAAAHRARASGMSSTRLQHPNAYTPWTSEEEQLLLSSYSSGMAILALAKRHGRNPGAIRARLRKLDVSDNVDVAQSD
jgi:hypothetical protein